MANSGSYRSSNDSCVAVSSGSFIDLEGASEYAEYSISADASYMSTGEMPTDISPRAGHSSFSFPASRPCNEHQPFFAELSSKRAFYDSFLPPLRDLRVSSSSYQSLSAGEAAASGSGMAANIAATTGLAFTRNHQPVVINGCITLGSKGSYSKLTCQLYSQKQMLQLEQLRQQFGVEQQQKQSQQLHSHVKKGTVLAKVVEVPQQLYNM